MEANKVRKTEAFKALLASLKDQPAPTSDAPTWRDGLKEAK